MTRRLGWAIIIAAAVSAAVLVETPRTRARFLSPAYSESAFARGVHSLEVRRLTAAERYFRDAVRYQPHAPHLRSRIGLAYLQELAKHPREEVEKAVLFPAQRTRRLRIVLQFATHATAWLESALRIGDGEPAQLRFLLGDLESRLGRYAQASRHFEQLVVERPTDAMVLNDVGYTYLTWPSGHRSADHALDLIQRAARLRPNDGMILDSLGWAYYKLGHTRIALHWLLKAARLERSAEIYLHVAQVYDTFAEHHQQLKDWDDLKRQEYNWTKRALLTNPNLPEARKQWQAVSVWYYESD